MVVLIVLLFISGVLIALAFGAVGYVIGASMLLVGALLAWGERRRRQRLADDAADPARPADRSGRPGWQLLLIIVAAVFVGIVGLVALIWRLTAGLVDTANAFFAAVRADDMEKAHAYLSKDFRAAMPDTQLRMFLKNSRLTEYESASWSSRSLQSSQGKLSGTITTTNGAVIPMTVTLVREGGEWRILGIVRSESGLISDDTREQPTLAEQTRLVRETTGQFVAAIEARDFTGFHERSSGALQGEASPQRMHDAFVSIMTSGIDLQPVTTAEPRITTTGFNSIGQFGIEGTYALDPQTFTFRYDYAREGVEWKLSAINVQIR